MSSEDQLINRVGRKLGWRGERLVKGIGDDAAVIRPGARLDWVLTTDAFIEKVHFDHRLHAPRAIGYKALARATSDLAAMGAAPRYFLLTIALPSTCTGNWFDEFLSGMALAARRFGLILIGGDTTKHSAIFVSLTVLGEVDRGRAILRSGARPGDLICVSGRLGEAELGLRLVRGKVDKWWQKLLRKHLYPEPRLALGKWLLKHHCVTAMIDTSDGLSTDLGHLCKSSGVGARVWAEKIPAVQIPTQIRERFGLTALPLALDGGEDYELLFTLTKSMARRLPRKVGQVPLTVIGEVTSGTKIMLIGPDRKQTPLRPKGWDPFRQS